MATTVFSANSATLQAGESNLVLTEVSGTENFENFAAGPIANNENGWNVFGTSDQTIVSVEGDNKLRMSSDPNDGSFGGPYSPALSAAAGEAGIGAVYQNHTISFTFKAVNPGDSSRLEVDFGNDAGTDRNNFLVLESTAAGLRIAVNEPTEEGDFTINDFSAFTGNRQLTLLTGTSAAAEHTLEMRLEYVDGSDNDVIGIYLDGTQIGTTTTFENYYEFGEMQDHDTAAAANVTSRLFFRGRSSGAPEDGPLGQNQGFLFDDISNKVFNHADATGNSADNILLGNSGDNVLTGLGGNDILDGGTGNDTAAFTGSYGDYVVTASSVSGLEGNDSVANIETFTFSDVEIDVATTTFRNGTSGANVLTGASGTDAISGLGGADKLQGGDGDDIAFGGGGKDIVNGGAGNDLLSGGIGSDTLSGGADADVFLYNSAAESKVGANARDVIRDFQDGIDKIDLDALNVDFADLDIRIVDKAGVKNDHTYVSVDLDADGKADFQIDLVGVHALNSGDFLL